MSFLDENKELMYSRFWFSHS